MKRQKTSSTPKTEPTTLPNTKKSDEPEFTYDQLLQALYWTWDAFDRSLMQMFLVYETAEDVLNEKLLTGNKITVGVRDNEWRSGSTPILKAFMGEPVELEKTFARFVNPFNEVPVYVFFFPEDACTKSLQQRFYEREYFLLPNPYSRFKEIFYP